MLRRLKEKWEVYVLIFAMIAAGYYGREYLYDIEESNELWHEKSIRHSDYRDSLFNVKWVGTENIEEGRYQAAERHRIRTEMALENLKEDIDRYHYRIRRDLSNVADTQAEAIRRDSIRRAGSGPLAPIIITR